MKRIVRNPEKFEVIDLFEAIARKRDLKLGDKESEKNFIDVLSRSFSSSRNNPVIIHGRHIESMFEHVVASLGKSILIKREDSGEVCTTDPNIQPPDFRILLDGGTELFVEVKNCHQEKPSYRFSFKKSYLSALENYAHIFRRDLWIAIFWSRWKKWTLIPPSELSGSDRPSISMLEAFKCNEMSLLGDIMVGTTPPLTLRIIADQSKPRHLDSAGQVAFTIGGVELYCSGIRIEDDFEKNLAFYFMLNSDWVVEEPKAKIENKALIHFECVAEPEAPIPNQGFQLLGMLSEMISQHYNDLTASTEGVERLSPAIDPGLLGVLIPNNCVGKQLPLWRFTVKGG